MKKTYMIPELETIDLKINQQLLAGSEKPTSTETPSEWGAPGFDFFEE